MSLEFLEVCHIYFIYGILGSALEIAGRVHVGAFTVYCEVYHVTALHFDDSFAFTGIDGEIDFEAVSLTGVFKFVGRYFYRLNPLSAVDIAAPDFRFNAWCGCVGIVGQRVA